MSDILQSITGKLAVDTRCIRKRVNVDRKLCPDAQVTGYLGVRPLGCLYPVAPPHEMITRIRHRRDRHAAAAVFDVLRSNALQRAMGTSCIRERVYVDRKLCPDAQVTGYVYISPLRRRQPVAPTHEMIPRIRHRCDWSTVFSFDYLLICFTGNSAVFFSPVRKFADFSEDRVNVKVLRHVHVTFIPAGKDVSLAHRVGRRSGVLSVFYQLGFADLRRAVKKPDLVSLDGGKEPTFAADPCVGQAVVTTDESSAVDGDIILCIHAQAWIFNS